MDTNISLNDLVKEQGEVFDESSVTVTDIETVVNALDENSEVEFPKNSPVWESAPLPGQQVTLNTDNVITEKAAAAQNLIKHAAIMKAQKERDIFNKKSDDEKVKEVVIAQLIKNQENAYFEKYGYIMSGQQRRRVRKSIETGYKKGKYRLSAKDREDLLYQLSLSSNTKSENSNTTTQLSTSQTVNNLMSHV